MGGTKNGKKEGFGIEKWNNNSKYIGFYKDDLHDGYGKLRLINGDTTYHIEGYLFFCNFFRMFYKKLLQWLRNF